MLKIEEHAKNILEAEEGRRTCILDTAQSHGNIFVSANEIRVTVILFSISVNEC